MQNLDESKIKYIRIASIVAIAGNAVLAVSALGHAAIGETARRMIRFSETFAPGSGTKLFWDERYALYKEARERGKN